MRSMLNLPLLKGGLSSTRLQPSRLTSSDGENQLREEP